MITPHFIAAPCRCGRPHRLPVAPDGVVAWLCGSTRKVSVLRLHPVQFQRLLLTTPTEQQLHVEGACVVHRAAEPHHDQQRCEDCGWLLVSYRAWVRRHPMLAQAVQYWPTGALVGRSIDGSYYFAKAPLSPHRERHCFVPEWVH